MSRLIKYGFVGLVLLCLCGGTVQADVFGDFEYTDHGTYIEITGYSGAGGDLVIPATINGKPVTNIRGKVVFYHRSSLTSVFIPSTVTSIGNFNFSSCNNLTSIVVDSNNSAFSSDGGVLFNKTQTILVQYPGALAGSYTVPSSVIELGFSAFHGCNLTHVALSENLSDMGSYALNGSSLMSIGVHSGNPNYSSYGGLLFNKTKTKVVRFPTGRSDAYQIPLTVTDIDSYAFYSCRELPSVTIPSSVTNIGYYAFGYCYAIDDITLPSALTSIENRAFFACISLLEIDIPASVVSIGALAFGRCDSLVNVTIPSTLTEIKQRAFWNCEALTSVTFEDGVDSIGDNAFEDCGNLLRAYFLGDAPSMGSDVFIDNAAGFSIYYLAGKAGFSSPPLNGYPSVVATLPPAFPAGSEPDYEAWVLTNVVAWGTSDFSAIPTNDFEKAWLVNTMPAENMDSIMEFHVEEINVASSQIALILGLNINGLPKAGEVNGWLTIRGRESLTTNEWQTVGGQSADQDKLSFSNGQAQIVFDCPSGMYFFMPILQKELSSGGVTIEAQ